MITENQLGTSAVTHTLGGCCAMGLCGADAAAAARVSPPSFPARPVNGGTWKPGNPTFASRYKGYSFGPKYNGWYALIHIPTRTIFNRHGNRMTIGSEFDRALDGLYASTHDYKFEWVASEALSRRHSIGKGTLIVLDCIPVPEYRKADYALRRLWLRFIPELSIWAKPSENSVYREPQDRSHSFASPDHLWADLQQINKDWNMPANTPFYEGIVAKRQDAEYPVQLRSPDETSTAYVKFRWKF